MRARKLNVKSARQSVGGILPIRAIARQSLAYNADPPYGAFTAEVGYLRRLKDEAFRSIVNVFPCQVHWGDCDPAGIIFYPTYFRWIDAASWALFDAVGYGPKWMRANHKAMPLVSAECQFLFPAEHGDRCEVRSRIARFGGKSFVVEHDIVRADGTVLAKGKETRVWGRYVNGPGTPMKGEPIPEELRQRFRAQ